MSKESASLSNLDNSMEAFGVPDNDSNSLTGSVKRPPFGNRYQAILTPNWIQKSAEPVKKWQKKDLVKEFESLHFIVVIRDTWNIYYIGKIALKTLKIF